ncbi:MAG: hypothetical protein JSR65_13845 [Proteobacteria bacterium]|nr:hypothetical protein [Pseudomonadota bacterium]
MRTLLALVLTASMPLVGVAQSLAPATQNPLVATAPTPQLLEQLLGSARPFDTGDTRAVPLWGTPDGRILTLVASTGNPNPILPKSPQFGTASEWRLIDVTNLVSGGLLMRIGNDASVHASLGHSRVQAPLASGCAPQGVVATPCANLTPIAHGGEFRLGTRWVAAGNLELGLDYNVAWQRHDTALPVIGAANFAALGSPAPPLGLASDFSLDATGTSINALGRFHFGDERSLNLDASVGRIQLSIPGMATPLTSLNQAAVSFGVQYGAFGGNLTGHALGPAELIGGSTANSRLTGVDLGISWRTPWSGLFRFGTQNLWSSGSSLPYLNNGPVSREIESSQARVPYVQYHQDL